MGSKNKHKVSLIHLYDNPHLPSHTEPLPRQSTAKRKRQPEQYEPDSDSHVRRRVEIGFVNRSKRCSGIELRSKGIVSCVDYAVPIGLTMTVDSKLRNLGLGPPMLRSIYIFMVTCLQTQSSTFLLPMESRVPQA